jgi:hypothetical protein
VFVGPHASPHTIRVCVYGSPWQSTHDTCVCLWVPMAVDTRYVCVFVGPHASRHTICVCVYGSPCQSTHDTCVCLWVPMPVETRYVCVCLWVPMPVDTGCVCVFMGSHASPHMIHVCVYGSPWQYTHMTAAKFKLLTFSVSGFALSSAANMFNVVTLSDL